MNFLYLAVLSLCYGAPTNAQTESQMAGIRGAITNSQQVQDTLNRQLQDDGAHAGQARVNAFITGADSQIDNVVATIGDALSPITLGLSNDIAGVLLGPFVQSVTNGAEVLLSNLIGGGADVVDASMTAALTGNYAKLAALSAKNNVDASKLQNLSREITNTMSSKTKRATDSDLSGIHGSMTNYKQTVDTMKQNMENHKGSGARDTIDAFITGTDSQIDNAAATIADGLNGVTLGISGKIGDFLLGPFVQSVTNGAEVMISNAIGGSIDLVSDGTAKLFSKSLSKLHDLAVKMDVNENDTKNLENVQKKVKDLKAPRTKRATDSDLSGIHGSMTNYKQTVDTMKQNMENHKGSGARDTIDAFITGTDSQIDNAAATIADGLNGVTLGISGKIGDFLLGPFVQSVTNGAEVMISNAIGGSIDLVSDGTAKLFSKSLSKLHDLAVKMDVNENDTKNLENVQKKVKDLKAPRTKRATDSDLSGIHGSMTNYKQTVDTMKQNMENHKGSGARDTIDAFITGTDSQIDNAAATIADGLNGVTLGISGKIGDFLLGPFVQSVTNGAEVMISNAIGGSIDLVSDGTAKLFSKSLSKLHDLAVKMGVNENDTKNLESAQKKVKDLKAPKNKH